jgi:hypothetical protein
MDGLESARLKILRAMKHRHMLDECITEYTDTKPCVIVSHPNGEDTLNITHDPPPDVAIISGEIIYQVRSALDHLFFELVKRNHRRGKLRDKWERDCQFPLHSKLPSGIKKTPVAFADAAKISKAADWITDRAFTFIEGLQPYYMGKRVNQLLGYFCQLSNIDKHRYLNTTMTLANQRDETIDSRGITSTHKRVFLDHGAKIEPLSPPDMRADAVHMERQLVPQVAFNEPAVGLPYTCLVQQIIYQVPRIVWGQIIPAFDDLIRNP